MPNVATVLRAEIVRLAKKEVKTAMADAAKEHKELRAEIKALKKQIDGIQQAGPVVVAAPARRGRPPKAAAVAAVSTSGSQKIHSKAIKSLRDRLDVTQGELGQLLGLSNQSIYQYERKNGMLRLKGPVVARMEALEDESKDSVRAQLGERKRPGRKPGQTAKRGPGRPPKAAAKRGPGRPPKDPAKRGPGRPPKDPAKRGPGRPPKSASKTVAKRGPGRPPKAAAKRGPGRPPKAATKVVAKRGPGRPPKKRGPGRPPKSA